MQLDRNCEDSLLQFYRGTISSRIADNEVISYLFCAFVNTISKKHIKIIGSKSSCIHGFYRLSTVVRIIRLEMNLLVTLEFGPLKYVFERPDEKFIHAKHFLA